MRPIDADEMKNFFKGNNEAVKFFHTLIDAQPTIDVAPSVHAHWIQKKSYDDKSYDFECSNCHRILQCGIFEKTPFCLWCGAKMDERVSK
jgi:hypothetical protein